MSANISAYYTRISEKQVGIFIFIFLGGKKQSIRTQISEAIHQGLDIWIFFKPPVGVRSFNVNRSKKKGNGGGGSRVKTKALFLASGFGCLQYKDIFR